MPKILRAFQKIFCGDVPASGNIAQFGSLKAGTPNYSDDPAVIQGLSAFGQGWAQAVIQQKSPALQDFNAIQHLVTRQLAYLLQAGIAEYDSATTYYIGSVVNSSGAFYVSKTDANTGNAVTNTTYWKPMIEALAGPPTAKAWCTFTGAGTLLKGYNVSNITRTAAGSYTITFATAMPDTYYTWSGGCGTTQVGGVPPLGSNNIVFWGGIKTTTQIAIGTWDAGVGGGGLGSYVGLEDPDYCSVVFFG